MNPGDLECGHSCRNSCMMLSAALREEQQMVGFYGRMLSECDYPEVHDFVEQLLEERSRSILRIVQKLDEMQARAAILDGIISSYNHPI